MKIARMKKVWDPQDNHLFHNGRYTAAGLAKFWSSIDNALQFNENLREKKAAEAIVSTSNRHPNQRAQQIKYDNRVVRDQRNTQHDKFHWSRNSRKRMEMDDPADQDYKKKIPRRKSLDFS